MVLYDKKKIFEYYHERRTVLHALANAIKVLGCLEFPLLPIYDECIMGKIIPSYYEYLEQNSKSIQNAKKAIMLQGKTSCSICGMNIREVYPGKEKILLEAHVTLPIAQLSGNERITLSDIIFLCPTCHKLAHSDPDFIEGKNLRESVKGR